MAHPSQVLLYVEDPALSAAFYAKLLKVQPKVSSPNFVVFPIQEGFKLSLLKRSTVEPEAPAKGGASELVFFVEDVEGLERLHREWVALGVPILFPPKLMYFGGHNFLGQDPDGHRLRASTPDSD